MLAAPDFEQHQVLTQLFQPCQHRHRERRRYRCYNEFLKKGYDQNCIFLAHCDFHYKFETSIDRQVAVYCSRDEPEPTWKMKENDQILPPCVYDESPCPVKELQTLTNGGSLVVDGKKDEHDQTSFMTCNDNGYFMTQHDIPLKVR